MVSPGCSIVMIALYCYDCTAKQAGLRGGWVWDQLDFEVGVGPAGLRGGW